MSLVQPLSSFLPFLVPETCLCLFPVFPALLDFLLSLRGGEATMASLVAFELGLMSREEASDDQLSAPKLSPGLVDLTRHTEG